MYNIKTSELLSGKSIVKELINIDVIKNISDDLFETKHHYPIALRHNISVILLNYNIYFFNILYSSK